MCSSGKAGGEVAPGWAQREPEVSGRRYALHAKAEDSATGIWKSVALKW